MVWSIGLHASQSEFVESGGDALGYRNEAGSVLLLLLGGGDAGWRKG